MLPTMPFAMIMSSSATYQTVITKNSIQNPDITTLLMGKPASIVLCTHWHDSRPIFNTSVRKLAEKWGFPVVEFDRYIGFSKNQNIRLQENNIA